MWMVTAAAASSTGSSTAPTIATTNSTTRRRIPNDRRDKLLTHSDFHRLERGLPACRATEGHDSEIVTHNKIRGPPGEGHLYARRHYWNEPTLNEHREER